MTEDPTRYQQAIEAIRLTLQKKPDLAIARYDLGLLYLKVGDRGSAIFQYRQLMKYDKTIAQKLLDQIFSRTEEDRDPGTVTLH